jgi:hypothetical protein
MKRILLYFILSVAGIHGALAQVPAQPVPVQPQFISSTGFEVRWHQPIGGPSVELYMLDVATDGSFTNFLPGMHDLEIYVYGSELLDRGYTVANLNPGTTYAWRVRSVSSGGTSDYSSTQFVTTKPQISLISPGDWYQTYATEFEDYISAIDSDDNGTVYFTGAFGNTLDIGTFSLNSTGEEDIFFAAMDSDGEILNSFKVGASTEDFAGYLKVYGDFAYTGMWLGGSADVDPGVTVSNQGPGFVLAKYNIVEGTLSWAHTFGANMDPNSIAVGPEGIILAGEFENVVDFDPGPNVNQREADGDDEGFIASYTVDGNLEWVGVVSGANEFIHEAVVDGTNVYVAGYAGIEDIDVNPGVGVAIIPATAGFLLKLDLATGSFVWAKDFNPGPDSYMSEGVTPVDLGTSIGIAGNFTGYVNFGDGFEAQSDLTSPEANSNSGYLVQISKSSGAVIAMSVIPAGYDTYFYVNQLQKVGNSVLIRGQLQGSVDFNFGWGGGERTIQGENSDAHFIASYSLNTGQLEWVKNIQFSSGGYSEAMHANADGLYAAGSFSGSGDLNPPAGDMVAMGNEDMYIVKYTITSPPPAPTAPIASAATDITGTGFTANWAAADGASYYRVDVSSDDFASSLEGYAGVIVQGATSLVVTDLENAIEYKYRVRAVTADGASNHSNEISVTTTDGNLPPPANFHALFVGNTGFGVEWIHVPDALEYRMDLSTDNFATFVSENILVNTADYPGWSFVDLQPTTEYQVRIRTVGAEGTGANTPTLFVTTLEHPAEVSANLWVQNFGSSSEEFVTAIASDLEGNIYVTGKTSELALTIGSFTLNPLGGSDVFIAKFNSEGVVQWAKRVGGSEADEGWHIAADASGVYVSGAFGGSADFDPDGGTTTLVGNGINPHLDLTYLDDGFIAKYDLSDGSLHWAKSIGSAWTYAAGGKSLYADGESLYATGVFVDVNDFDPDAGTFNLTSAGSQDIFLGRYNRWTGALDWVLSLGSELSDNGVAITGDRSNLYLAGKHRATIDLNPGAETQSVTGQGSFVSRFGKNGVFQWSKSFSPVDQSNGQFFGVFDMALDNDNIYFVGNFYGDVDVNPNAGTYHLVSTYTQGFGVKLSKAGIFRWAGQVETFSPDPIRPTRVIADAAGIYVVGYNSWNADFDPGPGQANRASRSGDIFVARYNGADGGFQWAKTVGSWGFDFPRSAAHLTNDGLYIGGGFWQTASFDPYLNTVERTSAGDIDGFIAKYESTSPPPPDAPVQLTPSFVSNSGVNMRWYEIPGIVEYRADVSTDNFVTFHTHDAAMVTGGQNGIANWTWIPLQPATTYQMRIRAVGPGGLTSSYSNVETFTTTADPVQAAPNIWKSTFGSSGNEEVSSIATDASGNVYATGYYYGDITIGSIPLTHGGNGDVFFAKYSSTGTVEWAKSLSSTSEEVGISVAVDATGVYVTGYFWAGANLDFDPNGGVQLISAEGTTYNAFMAKYSLVDGSFIWAKPLNDSWNATGKSIIADGTSIYITGAFIGTNDFDTGAGTVTRTAVGADDAYLARYSASDGSLVWVSTFGSTDDDAGYAVTLDGSFVYTSGYLIGTGDIDPGAGTNNISGAYFSKFNVSDGSAVWTKNSPGAIYAFDIEIDGSDLLVAGSFIGSADMDPDAGVEIISNEGSGTAGYVGRYTLSDGAFVSAQVIRATNSILPRRILADNSGYYIGGSAQWGVDFDPSAGEENRHAQVSDAILARYTSGGELVWAKTIGSSSDDVIRGGLALGPDGLYAAGRFTGTVNFDPYQNTVNATSNGSQDGFLAKYQIESSVPAAPTADAATGVTATGFTANWQASAGAANYRLDVSTSSTFAGFLPGYENITLSQLSKELAGLEPGTTYYYQVRAVNDAGASPNSNMITVSTAAAALAAPVANPGNIISATAFMTGWNSVASATGYQLDVSADDFVTFVPGYKNRSVAATSEGVLGLQAEFEYKYRVRAVGAGSTSANSNIVTVTTPGSAPVAPVAAAPTLITASSFMANWNVAANATGYKLDVSSDNFVTFLPDYNAKPLTGTSEPINDLMPNTSYQYRVRATNAGGTSVNSNVIVAVTVMPPAAPELTVSSVTIESFVANWTAVEEATSYRIDVSSDNFNTFLAGYNDKVVSGNSEAVGGLTPSTSYQVRVRAVNANGTSANSGVVFVSTHDLPNPPNASAPSSVTATSFVGNWSTVSGATSYRLDVSSDNFVNFIPGYSDKAVSTNSDAVTGLTPSTAYKYRVRTVDAYGTSINSNVVDVMTNALPNAPTATAATAITLVGFTANWNAVAGATSYRLDVSTDNFATYVPGYSDKSVTATSDAVSGLTPNTAYKYRVRTVNADGTSGNSNVIDVSTPAVPAAPVATAATNVTPNTFTANWTAVEGADSYQLDVSADDFVTFRPGYSSKSVNGLSDLVTPLEPAILYKYRVRAVNSNGASLNSAVVDVTTSSLSPPIAQSATNVTSIGFTASWNPVDGATAYLLFVSADNFVSLLPNYAGVTINATSTTVTGLSSGTTYSYKVRATSPSNTSTDSNIIQMTTAVPPPVAPLSQPATNVSTTGFTANWNSVADATGYRLDVSDNNFAGFIAGYQDKAVSGTSEVVSGLDPATAYQYRVRAENAGGVSANSGTVNVQTALPLPDAPGAVAASSILTTSFIANWNSVSTATSYRLDVSADDFVNFVAGYNDKEVDATFEQVTGLSPSTLYKYRVRAVDPVGTSANSNVINATTLAKQNQTITFAAIESKTIGTGFALSATATSGLEVTFAPTTDHTTITGNNVTLVRPGRATITASQAGDDAFNAATPVAREFCINPAKPTITSSNLNTEEPVLTSSSLSGNQWFKDGIPIDNATGTTYNVTVAGIYTVRVTIETCQSVMSDEEPIIVTGDIAILGGSRIVLAPNPVERELLIQMRDTGTKQIAIYNASGALATTLTSNRDEEHVDVSSYAGGLYIVKIVSESGSYAGQFIKK